ncbi:helix-turn-helix domain-containing protein [Streptomyces yaanensis]|uniref:Helix-turn-helix domain-containing protein n=2 Tax=Streptomyces TaxID=1883 RepID=A0ABV7SBV4_9ACTN
MATADGGAPRRRGGRPAEGQPVIDRAFALLGSFDGDHRAQTLAELAQRSGIPRSSALRARPVSDESGGSGTPRRRPIRRGSSAAGDRFPGPARSRAAIGGDAVHGGSLPRHASACPARRAGPGGGAARRAAVSA